MKFGEFPVGPVFRSPHFHLPWAWVQSLVGELKFCNLQGSTQKKKKKAIFFIKNLYPKPDKTAQDLGSENLGSSINSEAVSKSPPIFELPSPHL